MSQKGALLPPVATTVGILLVAILFGRPFASLKGSMGLWEGVNVFLVVSVAAMAVMGLTSLFANPTSPTEDEKAFFSQPLSALLFEIVLLVPFIEEIVFRYVIVGATYKWGAAVAVGMSAFFFGAVHRHYKLAKMVKGGGYAWLYIETGTLWAPFLAHATWNLGCVVVVWFRKLKKQRSAAELT